MNQISSYCQFPLQCFTHLKLVKHNQTHVRLIKTPEFLRVRIFQPHRPVFDAMVYKMDSKSYWVRSLDMDVPDHVESMRDVHILLETSFEDWCRKPSRRKIQQFDSMDDDVFFETSPRDAILSTDK
jgi:hypothetical protein